MAFDTFIKLDGIDGEATADKMEKTIQILSFSFGVTNAATFGSGTGGGGSGKATVSGFSFNKETDSSSPKLFLYCCNGKHISKGKVSMRKAGGSQEPFLEYDFEDLVVESVQWSGAANSDDKPMDMVTIGFGKITTTYKPQKKDGTFGTKVTSNWDIKTSKGA